MHNREPHLRAGGTLRQIRAYGLGADWPDVVAKATAVLVHGVRLPRAMTPRQEGAQGVERQQLSKWRGDCRRAQLFALGPGLATRDERGIPLPVPELETGTVADKPHAGG